MFDQKRNLLYDLLALFASACALRVLIFLHGFNPTRTIDITLQITEGRAPWIAFQNRLTGPWSVRLLTELGVEDAVAFWTVIFLALAGYSIAFQRMVASLTGSSYMAAALLSLSLLMVLTLHDVWLYTWDIPDMLFFALLVYGVLRSWNWRAFLLLFAVAIISRETALFVGVYFLLDSFHLQRYPLQVRLIRPRYLVIGIVVLLVGATYTKFVRDSLFISTPSGESDAAHRTIGNHIYFSQNVKDLFVDNWSQQYALNSMMALPFMAYCLYVVARGNDRQTKVAAVALGMVVNVLIFGLFNESRMLLPLIPVGILLVVDRSSRQQRDLPMDDNSLAPIDDRCSRLSMGTETEASSSK